MCLPVPGVASGAIAAGLLHLSTGRHSITLCSALAVSERGLTARTSSRHQSAIKSRRTYSLVGVGAA